MVQKATQKRKSTVLYWLSNLFLWLQTPNIKIRTNFFRLMAISQEVWLGLRDSVINIMKTERNSVMKQVQAKIIEDLSEGKSFAHAMESHPNVFASNEIELVRAAESIGSLPSILREIATEMENMQKIYQRIQSAITYPSVLLFFSVVAVIILLIYVVPTIVSLFPDTGSLPSITLFMLSASSFLQKSWFALLLGIVAAFLGANILYRVFLPFKKIIDRLMISIPFLGDVTKTFYMYRFSKLLWDFSQAGVPAVKSFVQINKIFSNYYYKRLAYAIGKDLKAGFSLWDSIEGSKLFDPLLIQVITVWENTGNLGQVLLSVSKFYRYKFQITIASLMSLIEPLLMAIVAVIIWVIVASIFLPIADLVNVIAS